jgi:cytochrome c553
MALDLGNLLQKYLNVPSGQPSADVSSHFDEVAQQASPQVMGQGIADALRSDDTPPLGQMVSEMFQNANPHQQAGMLNQILASVNPGVLGSLGGVLGGLAGQVGGGHVQITPQQASEISPQQVQDLANHAEQHSPGIFDKLGEFYAQHPQLVKTLGSAALTIALAKMANRMRS